MRLLMPLDPYSARRVVHTLARRPWAAQSLEQKRRSADSYSRNARLHLSHVCQTLPTRVVR